MEVDGTAVLIIAIVTAALWWILEIIGSWKLFRKAGRPGWLSIIPFVNVFTEYSLCWKGSCGILMMIALIVANTATSGDSDGSGGMTVAAGIAGAIALLLQIVESHKLARAFGKGIGYTLLLIIFDRLGRIILGFSNARYIGKR